MKNKHLNMTEKNLRVMLRRFLPRWNSRLRHVYPPGYLIGLNPGLLC